MLLHAAVSPTKGLCVAYDVSLRQRAWMHKFTYFDRTDAFCPPLFPLNENALDILCYSRLAFPPEIPRSSKRPCSQWYFLVRSRIGFSSRWLVRLVEFFILNRVSLIWRFDQRSRFCAHLDIDCGDICIIFRIFVYSFVFA